METFQFFLYLEFGSSDNEKNLWDGYKAVAGNSLEKVFGSGLRSTILRNESVDGSRLVGGSDAVGSDYGKRSEVGKKNSQF